MKAVSIISTIAIFLFNLKASSQLVIKRAAAIVKAKQERLRLYTRHDSNSHSDGRLVCEYSCAYDDPRSIDEEYWQDIDIGFLTPPVAGKTYLLPHKDITISGTFTSVWVWDRTYADSSTMGRIHVVRYKNHRKLVLVLDLFQFRLSQERDTVTHRIL